MYTQYFFTIFAEINLFCGPEEILYTFCKI